MSLSGGSPAQQRFGVDVDIYGVGSEEILSRVDVEDSLANLFSPVQDKRSPSMLCADDRDGLDLFAPATATMLEKENEAARQIEDFNKRPYLSPP